LQAPWGRLSDRLGRRVPFLVLGTAISSALFVLIAASASPWQLILVVLFQAIAVSAVAPIWGALLGEKTGTQGRGRVFGSLSQVAGVAGLAGTILAAFILFGGPETSAHPFQGPFLIAAGIGIASSLVLLLVPERKRAKGAPVDPSPDPRIEGERRADFLYFVKAQSVYNFFMSFAWPLIPITVAGVLGATNLDVVMITVVTAISTVVLQTQVGRLLDRVGPVVLIQASRFLFIFVPLAYGFANSLVWIYLISAFMGVPTAIVNIAFNAYILDVAPAAKRAEYFGQFNGAIGIVTFAGSLLGGYAAWALRAVWPLWLALLAMYLVSAAGRTAGAFLCLHIRDPATYPEAAGSVWRRFEHHHVNGRH